MRQKVARLFGGSREVWMRLQATYDLNKSAQDKQDKKVMERIARIVPLTAVDQARA